MRTVGLRPGFRDPLVFTWSLLYSDAPRIHHLPRRVVLLEGAEWTLNCSVESEPPAHVSWSKFALTDAERARLHATLTSSAASTSASASARPESVLPMRSNELLEQSTAGAATAAGDGGDLKASDQEDASAMVPPSATPVLLHMERVLHLQPAQRSDAGHYACVATNALGSATSSQVLILVASWLSFC